MDLLTKMVEHHVWLTGEMVDRAGRLDDAVLDKPIEISVEGVDDDPTLRSLLSRLVGQMGMWNAAMASRDYDWSVEKHEPIESMQAPAGRRRAARTWATSARSSAQGRLDDTFVDALCEPAEVFTYGGDDRPRADVRRASPDARRGRADRRRDHRSRRRRSAAAGSRRRPHDRRR